MIYSIATSHISIKPDDHVIPITHVIHFLRIRYAVAGYWTSAANYRINRATSKQKLNGKTQILTLRLIYSLRRWTTNWVSHWKCPIASATFDGLLSKLLKFPITSTLKKVTGIQKHTTNVEVASSTVVTRVWGSPDRTRPARRDEKDIEIQREPRGHAPAVPPPPRIRTYALRSD